jgi:hypothetical protein
VTPLVNQPTKYLAEVLTKVKPLSAKIQGENQVKHIASTYIIKALPLTHTIPNLTNIFRHLAPNLRPYNMIRCPFGVSAYIVLAPNKKKPPSSQSQEINGYPLFFVVLQAEEEKGGNGSPPGHSSMMRREDLKDRLGRELGLGERFFLDEF